MHVPYYMYRVYTMYTMYMNRERERERERGMLGDAIINDLREAIDAPRREFSILCLEIIRATILGSFSIWASRNHDSDFSSTLLHILLFYYVV